MNVVNMVVIWLLVIVLPTLLLQLVEMLPRSSTVFHNSSGIIMATIL